MATAGQVDLSGKANLLSDPASLAGRVAVVTGAGTLGDGIGVGRAISIALARQKAKLVLIDLDDQRADATAALVAAERSEAIVCQGDVSSDTDCARIVAAALEAFGTIDVLVNNAAVAKIGTVTSLSDEDWAQVLAVTLMGAARMSRHVVPVMEAHGGGSIVNISSICGSRGYQNAAYTAAKGGLEALTRDMSVAHGRAGIRVNAIAPGHLRTPHLARVSQGQQDDRLRQAASPLGTEGTAWDVAWAVEFLASERARWITGVTLPVDGGVLATSYLSMVPIIGADRA